MCIYNKLYIISEWRVNCSWVCALRKSDVCILLYFPSEINSAVCLWKIWDGNNCNFATCLDAVLLCRIGLFFCCSCHAEEHFLMWARYQADVQTSRYFCCCEVILFHLLSLWWLYQQTVGHPHYLTSESFVIRLVAFYRDCSIYFKEVQFPIPIGRKNHVAMG